MIQRRIRFSPFIIPIAAFALWNYLFFSYLPVIEVDLDFSRQIILANLYLSNIILILTWFLCGQIVFIIFALIFALQVFYLMLSLGDLGIGVQNATIVLLYLWLKHLTDRIEKESLNELMGRDRIQEDLNLAQKTVEEKEHLLLALHRKRDRLNYMRKFSDHLKEATSLESAGHVIVEEVAGLIPEADQVLLYVYDDDKRELGLVAQSARNEDHRGKAKRGDEYDEWVIKRSQPLLIEDTHSDFRFMSAKTKDQDYRSLCLVPLLSKSTCCGVLHLSASDVQQFQTDDLRLMDIVADLSAVVIRNIMLYEKTKELAIMDSLTECYLLRYVQERLVEEIHRSIRNNNPFSVVMADIDHFKRINDDYGHTAGDQVLRQVAGIIRRKAGSSDIVGRYGGEEFILVLPQKDAAEAANIAEGIRKEIEEHDFRIRQERIPVTISIGHAQFPADGTGKEELIHTADERLYEAKRRGRNQVCGSI